MGAGAGQVLHCTITTDYDTMSWEIFDRFYNAHWFLTGHSCRNFSELLHEGGTESISRFIGVMINDVNLMIFDDKEFDIAGNFYADHMINDHGWRTKMYKKHNYYLRRYFKKGEHFRKLEFRSMSDEGLIKKFDQIAPLQEQVRIFGVMLNGLVLDGRNHLSNKIRNGLKKFIKDNAKFGQYWTLLTQVTKLSMRQRKEIEIARLAAKAKTIPQGTLHKQLRRINEQYCWLDYMYYGPSAPFAQFVDELKEAIQENTKLHLVAELKRVKEEQNKLMRRLHFNARARHLVSLAQYILWEKGWRKDVEYHGLWCYEPFFQEVARRKKLTDWRDLLYLLPWEVEGCLLRNKPNPRVLKERRKFSCLIVDRDKLQMLIGRKARTFYKQLGVEKDISEQKDTRGSCAYAGRARGYVRIVQVPGDMVKIKKGDILVSQATSPDLLPAMKKAAAIVTNTGGLICHAAITARELKIPCVVGTTNATLIFKDGDLVEVDAEKGVVRKI